MIIICRHKWYNICPITRYLNKIYSLEESRDIYNADNDNNTNNNNNNYNYSMFISAQQQTGPRWN